MYDEGTEGYRDCNDDADDWDEVKKTLPSRKKPHWCGARFEPEGLLSSVPTVSYAITLAHSQLHPPWSIELLSLLI